MFMNVNALSFTGKMWHQQHTIAHTHTHKQHTQHIEQLAASGDSKAMKIMRVSARLTAGRTVHMNACSFGNTLQLYFNTVVER